MSRGEHNITFSITIDGVVRGFATQTFTVLEGKIHTSDNLTYYFAISEVLIEFRDVAYSVVEGMRFYYVTVVKQGEPGEDIVVSIVSSPDPTAADTVECKSYNNSVIKAAVYSYIFIVYKL